jgi:anti-sigma factor RsiW
MAFKPPHRLFRSGENKKMRQPTEQDERMTRYLLGDLPETEQTAVEQEYFADPEKFEDVWAAENELVDRYVRGRLSRGERDLFERNYLQSPRHRERVATGRKLLEAADRLVSESGVAPQAITPAPGRLMEMLKALLTPRFLAPATAFLLLLSFLSWMMIERSRLNEELERAQAQLADQQRREREIAAQLDAEREQGAQWKSRYERALESFPKMPSLTPPSILSFLLKPGGGTRNGGDPHQQITIPRETEMVNLQMKIDKGDSRRLQATIKAVGRPEFWRRSIKPRSGVITVTVPANKLPVNDYILTLSVATPTGETEEISNAQFRVLRK